MTSFAAYDAGLPCENRSCKSFGHPHPNCKCHGMAEGGEVEGFCKSEKSHKPDCEYYAEGGEVEAPQHSDPSEATASYLAHKGLHGLIEMSVEASPESIEKYNKAIKHGKKSVLAKIEHLFTHGSSKKEDYSKAHKTIHEWIDKGGITNDLHQEMYKQNSPQQFAEGGKVEGHAGLADPHIAHAYPDHNIALQATKGNASKYLSELKSHKNAPRLAFDGEPDTRDQDKSYKRAVKIAANPLHVLDKIKSGEVEPEHIKHLAGMYPEMTSHLQKKLTERIIKAQLSDEKPKYHVRQGLSMLLGTSLSGEMVPQNIQAAQNTFHPPGQKQEAQAKPSKSAPALQKADQTYLTGNQARVERQQKQ